MANETTIKIKATPDGKDCTFEIVEEEAKTGTRIDQVAAQGVLNMDKMLRPLPHHLFLYLVLSISNTNTPSK